MPDRSRTNNKAVDFKRVKQETSYNCGPAVLEMLLSHFGIEASQSQIIEAAGIRNEIEKEGMVVAEMARAIKLIAPQMSFWFKTNSKMNEMREIVRNFDYPVGINWQGIFPDEGEVKDYNDVGFQDEDEGHFSVVVDVDTRENYIRIADPYGRFAGNDRVFSIVEFEKRWWDEDFEIDPRTKKKRYVYYPRMMFIVVPEGKIFPLGLGMKRL